MKTDEPRFNKSDREYISKMNLWASNIMDTILSNQEQVSCSNKIVGRIKTIIKSDKDTLKDALKVHNNWLKRYGLKTIKEFKYIKG